MQAGRGTCRACQRGNKRSNALLSIESLQWYTDIHAELPCNRAHVGMEIYGQAGRRNAMSLASFFWTVVQHLVIWSPFHLKLSIMLQGARQDSRHTSAADAMQAGSLHKQEQSACSRKLRLGIHLLGCKSACRLTEAKGRASATFVPQGLTAQRQFGIKIVWIFPHYCCLCTSNTSVAIYTAMEFNLVLRAR